ncbi:MAG: hypothetical protein JTT11_10440 [Candidatus Brockarchaeota archaeon]|nr:hypothetical protein [Candidatus Brockarchaeota archaeon]
MAGSSTAWFPTIFLDRCDGCEKFREPRCLSYCPNGVFEIRGGKAVVANPMNCVNGCNACEPVCPRKAISFPNTGIRSRDRIDDWSLSLRKVSCAICGKEFWTNTDADTCFDCKGKSQQRGR